MANNNDDQKIQQAIRKYLLKHPDYFVQNADLLTELEVASPQGELASITTHLLKALQKENRQLKGQMAELVSNAQQSESVMNRLFDLLNTLSVVDTDAYLTTFVGYVTEHFPTDYFKLVVAEGLLPANEAPELGLMNASQLKHFSVFQAKSAPLSGRLPKEKIQSLFADVDDIGSAVVLPIGAQAEYGLLAFASRDEEKFHPHSASDLLQKLSQILVAHFQRLQPQDENQAMP